MVLRRANDGQDGYTIVGPCYLHAVERDYDTCAIHDQSNLRYTGDLRHTLPAAKLLYGWFDGVGKLKSDPSIRRPWEDMGIEWDVTWGRDIPPCDRLTIYAAENHARLYATNNSTMPKFRRPQDLHDELLKPRDYPLTHNQWPWATISLH